MIGYRRPDAPLALATVGAAFAVLAVMDKLVGLVQHPLHLATVAYASLALLLGWAAVKGIRVHRAKLFRISVYGAVLILNVLTAAYVLAWRVSADPTPVLLQARLDQGDRLLALGDKDGAHLVYRDAFRRYPGSFSVLMRMGAINYQVSDFERAARYYSRALEIAPSDSRWRVLNDLGQTFWKLGRPEEAISYYERASESGLPAAEKLEWHYRLAYAYFDARDYDRAIEHYSVVARAGGNYGPASDYNIACALAQKLADAPDPGARERLARSAVSHLRRAWRASTSVEDLDAFRAGLIGTPDEQDPELAPLRDNPLFRTFAAEIRSDER